MAKNIDKTKSVNDEAMLYRDKQRKKVKKLKKSKKVETTGSEKKDLNPAHNETHDDSDPEDINIILPSIKEQHKFAEDASHITKVQKFRKVLDKQSLGDTMWKYYVLDYRYM